MLSGSAVVSDQSAVCQADQLLVGGQLTDCDRDARNRKEEGGEHEEIKRGKPM